MATKKRRACFQRSHLLLGEVGDFHTDRDDNKLQYFLEGIVQWVGNKELKENKRDFFIPTNTYDIDYKSF